MLPSRRDLVPLTLVLGIAFFGCGEAEDSSARSEESPGARQERSEAEHAPEEHAGSQQAPAPEGTWALRSDAELDAAIEAAVARAAENNTKVLLEFGAEWCPDCREVARLGHLEPAAGELAQRYEHLHINVGRFDRHRNWLERFGIDRIATLVILDAQGTLVTQTTLEPLTGNTPLSAESYAAWLRNPSNAP